MIVTIKSYFSEVSEQDGVYTVTIPEGHELIYKKEISDMGSILDEIRLDDAEIEDIDFSDKLLTKEFVEKRWDNMLQAANEGSALYSTLDALGWKYEEAFFVSYDADCCWFDC